MKLDRLLSLFVSEGAEHIDAFELAIMAMRSGAPPEQHIDGAFRAVHSVKGACGTFGLTHLLEFSHDVESTLDRVRDGSTVSTPELLITLLEAADCFRKLLEEAQAGRNTDVSECEQVRAQLREVETQSAPPADRPLPASAADVHVRIEPAPDALLTLDPLSILQAIGELGAVRGHCHHDALPRLRDLDPEACQLSWDLSVSGVPEAELMGLLSWFDNAGRVSVRPAVPPADPPVPSAGSPSETRGREPTDRSAPAAAKVRSSSIRVDVDKIDRLMNMLGELVIGQTMLAELARDYTPRNVLAMQAAIERLETDTRTLQDAVMQIRMLPASMMLQRLPRVVDDLCRALGKEVDLVIEGERTEIDKRVLEELTDPVMHMLRNSIDHGIEFPDVRERAGKPRRGTLRIATFHRGGYVCVQIDDDGAGLNGKRIVESARRKGLVPADATPETHDPCELIFAAGLSTAEAVTDVSGRGVGMDVVRRNIEALGGTVVASSEEGSGCAFLIRLPLTLAIVDGQLIRVGGETYVVPLLSIIESIRCAPCDIHRLPGGRRVVRFRGGDVPVVALSELLGGPRPEAGRWALLMVVEGDRGPIALAIDELLSQQQVVVKSLDANYGRVEGISAATILGNGEVALIVDVHAVAQRTRSTEGFADAPGSAGRTPLAESLAESSGESGEAASGVG